MDLNRFEEKILIRKPARKEEDDGIATRRTFPRMIFNPCHNRTRGWFRKMAVNRSRIGDSFSVNRGKSLWRWLVHVGRRATGSRMRRVLSYVERTTDPYMAGIYDESSAFLDFAPWCFIGELRNLFYDPRFQREKTIRLYSYADIYIASNKVGRECR